MLTRGASNTHIAVFQKLKCFRYVVQLEDAVGRGLILVELRHRAEQTEQSRLDPPRPPAPPARPPVRTPLLLCLHINLKRKSGLPAETHPLFMVPGTSLSRAGEWGPRGETRGRCVRFFSLTQLLAFDGPPPPEPRSDAPSSRADGFCQSGSFSQSITTQLLNHPASPSLGWQMFLPSGQELCEQLSRVRERERGSEMEGRGWRERTTEREGG